MIVLGLETSCDETACAIVKDGKKILSSIIASSEKLHAKTGGIIPEQAARQQIRAIVPVIQSALKKARCQPTEIDGLAVTSGPGLIGSLLVGVETAKALAYVWKKPIVPVNHLVGHLYANWLETQKPPKFPALGLVVSGGHTDLVLIKDHGKIKWIGGTRDDAAGEAFDKTARLLGLGYPGGPAISALAKKYSGQLKNLFPRPLINSRDFDFSFSGLKTSVMRHLQTQKKKYTRKRLAAEIQEAIVEILVAKSLRAIKKYRPQSFILAGGVAANKRLREVLKREVSTKAKSTSIHVPDFSWSTDNAAYIAAAAYHNYRPLDWQEISARPELTIVD